MAKHTQWTDLWWALLQNFGKECRRTWSDIVIVTLAGGVASAAAGYLQTHGKQPFTEALWNGVIGAGIVFGIYALVHLIRAPWLEHKSDGTAETTLEGVGGMLTLILLIVGIIMICFSVADDLRTTPPLILGSADQGHKKADELVQLEECRDNYAALTQKEPYDSLRKRTVKVANEISDFLRGGFQSHPPYAYPSSNDPNPSEERKAAIKKAQEYDQKTTDEYMRKYKDRAVGIINEYRAKGVQVGFLEQSFGRGVPAWVQPGSLWEETPQNELGQFKELAFHVTAKDQMISPNF